MESFDPCKSYALDGQDMNIILAVMNRLYSSHFSLVSADGQRDAAKLLDNVLHVAVCVSE